MNFVAAFALLSASGVGDGEASLGRQEEADAFWLISCIMQRYGARGLFLEGTPLVHLYSFCISRMLERRLPEVHARLGGLEEVLGFKWFGTLFTTVLPFEAVSHAWDLLLRDGLTALLALALGLCSLMAPLLRAAEGEGEEALEVLGRVQRELPSDAAVLLPPGESADGGSTPETR